MWFGQHAIDGKIFKRFPVAVDTIWIHDRCTVVKDVVILERNFYFLVLFVCTQSQIHGVYTQTSLNSVMLFCLANFSVSSEGISISSIIDSSESIELVPNLIGFKIFDELESLGMGSDTVNGLTTFFRWPVPFTPSNGLCSNDNVDFVDDTDALEELFLAADDRFSDVESLLFDVDVGDVGWLSLVVNSSSDEDFCDEFSDDVVVCRFFRTITECGPSSSKLETTWYVS